MPRYEAQNIPTKAGSLCLPARAIELLAAATARLIDASAHDSDLSIEHAGSAATGLELADHAALSVPTGERHRPEPEKPGRCCPKETEGR
ncbi:MAG: hypothetical protein KF678_15630 [Phycisphaeraceae bacterium]|nr:hypothetical protein [Phycisphaeraceae bacterium]